MLPIIDTHQHLWDLAQCRPPWLATAAGVLNRTYVTKDYLQATARLQVVKAVYMEVDVAPEDQVAEARQALQWCRSDEHPTVAAVISGRPGEDGFEAYIRQFRDDSEIKGVRQVLHVPSAERGLCLQPRFVKSVRLLGELGLSFDLCLRPGELEDGRQLAQQCPDTRFVVDHCGNADPKAFMPPNQLRGDEEPAHDADAWRRSMNGLAALGNVICKISGIVAHVPLAWRTEHLAPIVNHCLDQFGPERVVFGGDWPVCLLGATYAQWVAALREIIAERPQSEQQSLLHDNAIRFYSLS